ncbi:MAG: copper-binding protein [Thermoanaerobaculia bacterium]|nr:copper-binding protein [Thermoanaerobaculia bacterium]
MLPSARHLRLVSALALAFALVHVACSRPPAAPAGPVESYAMRGEVVRLPLPGGREIAIRHEAVPDFRDESGKVVGMGAMTMPFTLAPDLPATAMAGLAPGDRIAFTLEMHWQEPSEVARISRLERLPAGTVLAWDPPPAAPPAAASPTKTAPGAPQ